MKTSLFFCWALALMAAPALYGCLPPRADFEVGFGTTEIVGTVNVGTGGAAGHDALVVILKNHYKFIPLYQNDNFGPRNSLARAGSITHPTAHVQEVGASGTFAISMPFDVVSVDVMFIAPDHLTDTFSYARSLGLGRITYRADLPPMPDWRGHFYTFLEPQLQDLIVDQRYQLADRDQKRLGDWLLAQKKRFQELRAATSEAEGPGEGAPAR